MKHARRRASNVQAGGINSIRKKAKNTGARDTSIIASLENARCAALQRRKGTRLAAHAWIRISNDITIIALREYVHDAAKMLLLKGMRYASIALTNLNNGGRELKAWLISY